MCSLNVKKCPKCGKAFNLDDIDEHMKSDHSYTICDLCGLKFTNNEIINHKTICDYRLVPCRFCELNVIFIELEEHENTCGSTTQKCGKCGLFIEKKNFKNHICQKKESEYLSEQIKIDKVEDDKKEKKKIKKKNNNKKNKKKNNIEIEKEFDYNCNVSDIDMNMIFSSHEIQSQIKAFNKFEQKKNKENNIKKEEDKKEKKKNKKKKELEKEEEKKEDDKINNKKKKGKKNRTNQNNKNNKGEDYFDEEDDYYPSKKKINLHNIKFDIPPEEYQNYNKNVNPYNYAYNDLITEENMILEAMKQSLLDQ